MALRIYEDSDATTELTTDIFKGAVEDGENLVEEKHLYICSDDAEKTYENVSITATNDTDGASNSGEIDYEYAPDDGGSPGTYVQTLDLSDGDFDTSVSIWRRATAPNVQEEFKNEIIEHQISFDEYIK